MSVLGGCTPLKGQFKTHISIPVSLNSTFCLILLAEIPKDIRRKQKIFDGGIPLLVFILYNMQVCLLLFGSYPFEGTYVVRNSVHRAFCL